MTTHLFRTINSLFRPNDNNDKDCLDTISIKKLKKGSMICSTTKTVLFWDINAVKKLLALPLVNK